MSNALSREQIKELLRYAGATTIKDNGKKNMQFCCPVHGESTPSMGIKVEDLVVHCFACHFSGNIQWLLFKTCPDEFKSVYDVEHWIKDRYGVDLQAEGRMLKRQLRRYEDMEDEVEESDSITHHEIPMYNLAPYKSGKETYKYFFNRGFNRADLEKFKIGRDTIHETVTVPIFNLDNSLCGIIGRFIDNSRPKNERYKIYDFPKGLVTYPVNLLKIVDDTLILVEGTFDAMWLHKFGYTNSQALQTNRMTYEQADLLKENFNFSRVIIASDNDKGGQRAIDIIKKRLGSDYQYAVVKYPEGKKDVQEMTEEEIDIMFSKCFSRKLKRIGE